MQSVRTWSAESYRPLFEKEKIYITRVVPGIKSIKLYWTGENDAEYTVSYRLKDSQDEWALFNVKGLYAGLEELEDDTDYEFFVSSDADKSLLGYARTGFVPGTVVNYLHPDDGKYAFSGQHLCTPSLLVHPDGYLLASMDLYEGKAPQNLTLIFRSDDGGETWYHYTELFPCFWGELFLHKNEVYMLAMSTEYGDILIGRSTDGGKTFCTPTVLFRGSCDNTVPGWHKSAMKVVEHGGRLWSGIDYGSHKSGGHSSALISVSADADLTDASAWVMSDPLRYNPGWKGAVTGDNRGFIEGNAVVMPDGNIGEILRYSTDKGTPAYGLVPILKGDISNPEKTLEFCKFVEFPGNMSKFDVVRDPVSGLYFTIFSRITDSEHIIARNVLSMAVSDDLEKWETLCDFLNYEQCDPAKVGFQYVSFCFDGEDIIFLCRTAFNGAQSFHDNNFITFHRVKNFRNLLKEKRMIN